MCLTGDFLKSEIEQLKAIILAYNDVILALMASNGVQEYTLDTGQTVQRV